MENGYKDRCSCCSHSRIYEDFVPSSELVHGKDYDTLLLNLPGFKKEEVKVQLCKTGILKISGQRPVNKFLSFQKDIPVSRNCDKSKINARLVNGILYVKHPKLITKKEKELPASTSELPEQDYKKTELDDLSKQDNAENSHAKQEPKTISPNISEKTQVKQDESTKDDTTRNASDLFAKLKVSRQVMNMALAAVVVLGFGRYVVNVMRSPKKAKE
ncbi:hypothetical protein FXO38_03027 [Capsicum annuum]|uniref:SHSP domain-containing protein n=1 Tax=Capsicum annuum TaxID=4072 RepID=A0A1U8FI97_CAPAN|nr:inactive protein RESTRICTED TEV MOVEMENT 2 [Capsicum annuum]XP_047258024.1 inactive protein RESTRICTED TEV MOVEMENT 2-like [Capsicum annuum]KAF3678885.1 hypothetical protein FXO38_03027 [Capsicum annuum]KAF3679851.1 hypothetical protein FXO37_03630 [Capsicum annuum]PHT94004.1 hypothetical protein T459_01886 [Capsicum annuum]